MTLSQITYFLELARTLNFTRAAANLYVSQSALSRQIQQLEDELGVQLLERSNRNVELTPAGEVFAKETAIVEDQIRHAVQKTREAAQQERVLNIYILPGVLVVVALELIDKLQKYFSGYMIHVERLPIDAVRRAYQSGEADIVVGLEGTGMEGLPCRSCVVENRKAYLVCPAAMFDSAPEAAGSHPVSPKDFDGKTFVHINEPYCTGLLDKQRHMLDRLGIHPCEERAVPNVIIELLYSGRKDAFSLYVTQEIQDKVPNHPAYVDDPTQPAQAGAEEALAISLGSPQITQEGLASIPLQGETFQLCAYWKEENPNHLNDFFSRYYPGEGGIG